MEPQKPGNSPRPGPEIVKRERERVAKERVGQIVCSWTVQNKMRGVLGRALQERFSILLILKRQKLNRRLCWLQRRQGGTQRE